MEAILLHRARGLIQTWRRLRKTLRKAKANEFIEGMAEGEIIAIKAELRFLFRQIKHLRGENTWTDLPSEKITA